VLYGLSWEKDSKKLKLLNVAKVDARRSLLRRLYTVLLVIPMGLGILFLVGSFTRIPLIFNLPLIFLVVWMIFTIVWASGIIIWKRENLKRTEWFDLIPPSSLLVIACFYAIFSFILGLFMLGLLMLITTLPYLLAFIFTLRKNRSIEESI